MKTFNQFSRFVAFPIFVCAIILSSCSSNSPTQVVTPGVRSLKVGDSFTYHDYATDLNGVPTAGSDTTLTAIVTQTSIPFAGKSNVSVIVKGSDTTYLADVSDSSFALLQNQVGIVSGISIPAMWIPFDPAMNGRTIYDSIQNATIAAMPAKVHMIVAMNYLGKDAITIGNNSLSIYKFSKAISVIVTVLGQDYTTTVTVTNNFAPSIGYMTQHNAKTESNSSQSPIPDGISYSLLQSYQIH